jgi:hypothetical protein
MSVSDTIPENRKWLLAYLGVLTAEKNQSRPEFPFDNRVYKEIFSIFIFYYDLIP